MLVMALTAVFELSLNCSWRDGLVPSCKSCYADAFILWMFLFTTLWFFHLYLFVLLRAAGYKPPSILGADSSHGSRGAPSGSQRDQQSDAAAYGGSAYGSVVGGGTAGATGVISSTGQVIAQGTVLVPGSSSSAASAFAEKGASHPHGTTHESHRPPADHDARMRSLGPAPAIAITLFMFLSFLLLLAYLLGGLLLFRSTGACAARGGLFATEAGRRSGAVVTMTLLALLVCPALIVLGRK